MRYYIMPLNVADMLLYSHVEKNAANNWELKFEYSFTDAIKK